MACVRLVDGNGCLNTSILWGHRNSQKTKEGLWLGIVVCDQVHACMWNSQETEDNLGFLIVLCDPGMMWKALRENYKQAGEESLMKISTPPPPKGMVVNPFFTF